MLRKSSAGVALLIVSDLGFTNTYASPSTCCDNPESKLFIHQSRSPPHSQAQVPTDLHRHGRGLAGALLHEVEVDVLALADAVDATRERDVGRHRHAQLEQRSDAQHVQEAIVVPAAAPTHTDRQTTTNAH